MLLCFLVVNPLTAGNMFKPVHKEHCAKWTQTICFCGDQNNNKMLTSFIIIIPLTSGNKCIEQ